MEASSEHLQVPWAGSAVCVSDSGPLRTSPDAGEVPSPGWGWGLGPVVTEGKAWKVMRRAELVLLPQSERE